MANKKQTVTILLRDEERLIYQENASDWQMHLMVAPLSADPRDFDEFTNACGRYLDMEEMKRMPWRHVTTPQSYGRWLMIDLVNQRLVASSESLLPESPAAYEPDEVDEEAVGSPVIWINLPPWWKKSVGDDWRTSFGPKESTKDEVDFREILYGQNLVEGIAKRVLALDRKSLPAKLPSRPVKENRQNENEQSEDEGFSLEEAWHQHSIKVHSDWLMTPRADLEGASPRDFLHRNRNWKTREIEFRQRQWSILKEPPRAVFPDTHIHRYGPMGLDEVVVYFDLCRAVIEQAWLEVVQNGIEDFAQLTEQLIKFHDKWLVEESIEGEPTSPIEIIESERRLMPRTADGTHLDCDCPLCRMSADEMGMGPMFTSFDGYHLEMENEFAFSLHENYEDWDAEQAEFEEFDEELDMQLEMQNEISADDAHDPEFESVWKSSHVEDDPGSQEPPQVAMLKLAFRLSELVGDLQTKKAPRNEVQALNGSFEQLRKSLGLGIEPSIASRELKEELESLAIRHPDLISKSADLQSSIDQWSRRLQR